MPRRMPLGRRLTSALAWPFGISLTSWNYLWRTTPLHRRERPGSPEEDAPPPLPAGVATDGLQPPEAGVGPLFHRRYRACVVGATSTPEELIAQLGADPNQAAPTEFARFVKVAGEEGALRPGDEFVVRMPGPWDGPVRVVEVTPTSFRYATLDGHLEAGQIEFRATREPDLTVTIESWARSGDQLSRLLHHQLHMAKEVQLHMWTSFLERIARRAGGTLVGGIDIDTRRVDEKTLEAGSGDGSRQAGDPAVLSRP